MEEPLTEQEKVPSEKKDASVKKSLRPSNWRYLWDWRRPAEIPAEPSRPSLPQELELVAADQHPEGAKGFLLEALELINGHYVADDDGMFRFKYPAETFLWSFLTPSCNPSLLLGLRQKDHKDGEDDGPVGGLVAFLGASPQTIVDGSGEEPEPFAMIDFVCVHNSFRGRRLCPYLYQEALARCASLGIHRLISTSGDSIPRPIATARAWHAINPASHDKLVECGWALPHSLPPSTQFQEFQEIAARFRPMESTDVPTMRAKFNQHVEETYSLGRVFDDDATFAHDFLPRPNAVISWVVDDRSQIEDHEEKGGLQEGFSPACFVSFYFTDTLVLTGKFKGQQLRLAMAFYSFPGPFPLRNLLGAAHLRLFQDHNVDMTQLTGIMGLSPSVSTSLKLGLGTGTLNYYLCNSSKKNGLLSPSKDIAWMTK